MVGPPKKRQRREENQKKGEDNSAEGGAKMPQKKFFRQRAHANPFSDHDLKYPESPEAMDWSEHYPAFVDETARQQHGSESRDDFKGNTDERQLDASAPTIPGPRMTANVEIVDIGCGYGGLLFALAPLYPQTPILGLEIRTAVTQFVQEKITAMRAQHATIPAADNSPTTQPPNYQNLACLRANAMKYLPNFFRKHQLRAIFLCFPDPHFKARKHKARIVSAALAAEYAYVLRPGGKIYTITDVEDLHLWMVDKFEEGGGFERMVDEGELQGDRNVRVMGGETEEGKKVERNGGRKFVAVFRRVEEPSWPGEEGG